MASHPSAPDNSSAHRFVLPILLAAVLTGLNAFKAPCIDDTAYLAVARQIASHPLDPYGFQQFWYQAPQPANEILAPPIIPYWLGLGIAIFGEHIVLLKLWLFPIALLLTLTVRGLLHRFARGVESPALVGFILSPTILPGFNFMLDIPELAIGATAISLFLRGLERDCRPRLVAAALLGAMAFETKYTGAIVLPVFLAAAIVERRPLRGVIAVAIAVAAIADWELFTYLKYGQSHFMAALDNSDTSFIKKLQWMASAAPTLLGSLGPPLVLAALAAFRLRRLIAPAALLLAAGVVVRALVPDNRYSAWSAEPMPLRYGHWITGMAESPWGWAFIVLMWIVAIRLIVRGRCHSRRLHLTRTDAFLIIWLAGEWSGYFILSNFAASRRLYGVILVATLLLARFASLTCRKWEYRRILWRAIVPGACFGLFFALVDISCSWLEPDSIQIADDAIAQHGSGKVWFTGHWGLQYAAERRGFHPLVPGASKLREGDWLIVAPAWMAPQQFVADQRMGVWPEIIVANDRLLRLRTLPSYYGGGHAIEWWPPPMFEARIYRIRASWIPRDPDEGRQ